MIWLDRITGRYLWGEWGQNDTSPWRLPPLGHVFFQLHRTDPTLKNYT